jgi:hypothetical protein
LSIPSSSMFRTRCVFFPERVTSHGCFLVLFGYFVISDAQISTYILNLVSYSLVANKSCEKRVYSSKASVVDVGKTYIKRVLPLLLNREIHKCLVWIENGFFLFINQPIKCCLKLDVFWFSASPFR